MDPFTIFLIVIITVITLLLVVTGIQVIFILRELSKTLSRLNQTIDTTHNLVQKISNPLSNMNSVTTGVKAGLQIADHIVTWARQRHQSSDTNAQT